MIRYLDVCSGYSAFTQANEGLGFECAGYAEIDTFPAALLGAHYGATRPRYMPDPYQPGIDAKERKTRLGMERSMQRLDDSHFGNRVVNFGDFTQIKEDDVGPVDLLIGGTPCQAFSQAGKRLGLDDPRGNLTLEFLALAKRLRVPWLAWENVPGFLSHDEGRTMGTFLRLLGELGYGFAWRVLDAQYIRVDRFSRAVPQRRNRLFVVGHLGDAAGPAAVLFERESLRGDTAPRRQAGEGFTHPVASGLVSSGRGVERCGETRGQDPVIAVGIQHHPICSIHTGIQGHRCDYDCARDFPQVAATLDASFGRLQGCAGQDLNHGHSHLVAFGGNNTAGPIDVATARSAHGGPHGGPHGRLDFESETFVAHSLRADGFDASEDGTGRGTPLVPVCFDARQSDVLVYGDRTAPLDTDAYSQAVAFDLRGREGGSQFEGPHNTANIRAANGGSSRSYVADQWAVRRLTPTECERLMAVRDGFTAITYRGKPAADGPRYKALGNSQAGNVMRWLAYGLRDVVDAQAQAKDIAA